jgi:hypothetical protein
MSCFVDLPNVAERASGVRDAAELQRNPNDVDLGALADVTEGFTGAELASLVPEAMFVAFADGARELNTDDLIAAARTVVPLSKTAKDKITAMRNWAAEKARPATTPWRSTLRRRLAPCLTVTSSLYTDHPNPTGDQHANLNPSPRPTRFAPHQYQGKRALLHHRAGGRAHHRGRRRACALETERTVRDPEEQKRALKARSLARSAVGPCSHSTSACCA